MKDVKGKVAVVTGGTSGIGLGIAKALALAGSTVVATYRTGRHLNDILAFLDQHPNLSIECIQLDVTNRTEMSTVADRIEERYGHIHILCNNAGVGILSGVMSATFDDWDWALSVNLGGVINGIQIFAPRIQAHGEEGHIVSTASMGGIFLGGGSGVYNTTKYAVVGLMEALSAEMQSSNVGVSVYCPGLVDTNIHESEDSRPKEYRYTKPRLTRDQLIAFKEDILSAGMSPDEAGRCVLAGILNSDLYIFSHPEFFEGAKERFEAILGSFNRDSTAVPMERIQAESATLRHPLYRKERDRKLCRDQGVQTFDVE
jgi:NAD(P)-dependent dehydrogenase (short-subunit alcohol dehydrogenase family)